MGYSFKHLIFVHHGVYGLMLLQPTIVVNVASLKTALRIFSPPKLQVLLSIKSYIVYIE